MTTHEKSPAQSTAQRQAQYKRRKQAQGYRRATLWIHQADFEAGYQAGHPNCPPGRDLPSWLLGYSAVQQTRSPAAPNVLDEYRDLI